MGTRRKAIHLGPGGRRKYWMGGRISSVFKADGKETSSRYAISEWWLEPDTKGPGAHSHEDDDVFYVLEGTMSIMLGKRWIDAPKGSFVLVPGGMKHDFENRSRKRAGMLNVSAPGGFEQHMPGIAAWFAERDAVD
jgi:mannose-6-phosphate isomerase-like protein (cupin superfamily)